MQLLSDYVGFSDVKILFYIARHGLKIIEQRTTCKEIINAVDLRSDHVTLIQMHMASMLSQKEFAVVLRQPSVVKIVTGEKAYFRPMLYYKYCHFSNGSGLVGGPLQITGVQAYDMASHQYRGEVAGMNYLMAVMGKNLYLIIFRAWCFVYIFVL